MVRFKDSLLSGKFVYTAEVYLPHGCDIKAFKRNLRKLKGIVDAVNLTDNQRALLRLSPLAGAVTALKIGIDPILHVSCRDRNRLAIQADLLGAWSMGVQTVLLITGDHPFSGEKYKDAKPVFDLDSVNLILLCKKLNEGIDFEGYKLKGKTDFFIGAAVNPFSTPLEPELIKFEKKIKAGAQFFQTQIVFDTEKFKEFMKYVKKFNTKIIAGIAILTSYRFAEFMKNRLPGVYIPDEVIKRLKSAKDVQEEGFKISLEIAKEIKNLCDGFYIVTMGKERLIPDFVSELKS